MALSLGFFGLFGRSPSLRAFDRAVRAVDLHPNLVPEAVKLAAVKLLLEDAGRGEIKAEAQARAAALLAYCMLGGDAFAAANGSALAADTEARIEAAAQSGEGLDARLILLALHAKVIQPSVVEAFQLGSSG